MKESKDIFSIARAFMKSRIILTAAELDLFSQIQRGYETSEKIAAKLNLNRRALSRVLDCLVTFGLLDKKGADYSLTDSGAPFSTDNPATSLPMVLHMSRLWESWSALTEIVEKGTDA